jgi:PAP2 superfamily
MPPREPRRSPVDAAGQGGRRGLRLPPGPPREALLIGLAMLLYFGVRNATAGSADAALANADRLERLERALGIGWERGLQSAVAASDALVTLANWVYIFGHWPVILGVATWLYLRRPEHYVLLRDAMFASGLIGFLLFALFPVAPPRLLAGGGFVDTVTERSDAYRALQPPGLTNQYAAFPSLHAGWNLLVGIVLALAVTSLVVRVVALAMPVAMALAVVATANHFVIDVAGGSVVVLIGLALAFLVHNRESASTLRADGVSGDRGGLRRDRAAVRRGASRGEWPRQTA